MADNETEGKPYCVEMPFGIFTAAGNWYHTTRDDIEDFTGDLLDHVALERLIEMADIWMRSPQILTLCLFPFLLLMFPTYFAAIIGLGFFMVAKIFSPGLASYRLSGLLKIFDHIALQFALYMAVLTWLAWWPDLVAVVAGLTAFIILRLRILDVLLRPLFGFVTDRIYRLPVPDQTFRAILVKAARAEKLDVAEVQEMEMRMMSNMTQSKSKK